MGKERIEQEKIREGVYAYHIENTMKIDFQPPSEDFIVIGDNSFAVFDGVTLLHQTPYPNPSPAAEAAKIGAFEAIKVIREKNQDQTPEDVLRLAFTESNKRIKEYNDSLGITEETINYVSKQYASTVGAVGFIEDGFLYYGQINDCGVMVLDKDGRVISNAIDDQKIYKDMLSKKRNNGELKEGSLEEHVFVRREVVNRNYEFRGRKITYGVLTGQEEAENFVRIGSCKLLLGQTLLFYSDGLIPFLSNQNFLNIVISEPENVEEFLRQNVNDVSLQKEKSVIIVKY